MLPLEGGRAELWRGDIHGLPESYLLGPGIGPVDILIHDPRDDGAASA